MSGIFGILGISDSDRSYVRTIGQRAVFDAVNQLLTQYNAEMNAAMGAFVDQETSDHKFRYYLPGGGRLQRRGGQAPSAATKALGSWDVAFPLEDFGAQLAGDDVAMAYMDMQQLNRHLDTIMIQDTNTRRFEMLRALFNNTARTFVDPIWGSLTVEPLANGDTITYPPVLGSETEATDDHYLESGYAASAISDTNNPFVTIAAELEEHFGASQGGSNIVSFINNAQTAKVEALTEFDPIPQRFVTAGTSTALADMGIPNVPGRVLGYASGCWIVEWRWVPANYILSVYADAPKPLIKRVDPADTGLGRDLQLVANETDYPLQGAHYRNRFGFGVGNRLNGVILELGVGGSYTIPTAYA